ELESKADRMRVDMVTFGGHRIATSLHPQDPRFQQLLQAYGDTAARSSEAFGLPTLDGAGTIFIRPRDIVEIRVDRSSSRHLQRTSAQQRPMLSSATSWRRIPAPPC